MRKLIMKLARDPAFVPHIYDYCDQWCRYCRQTDKCLLYRANQLRESDDANDGTGGIVGEGLDFLRAVANATKTTVAKLDVLLSDPGKCPRDAIGDPLELLGRQYAMQAGAFLQSSGHSYWTLRNDAQASPMVVVTWFHLIIASKIFRALTSLRRATRGNTGYAADAEASAKLVLVAIDRSRAALEEIGGADADARIASLCEFLGILAAAVEERFPAARAFLRPGLDDELVSPADVGGRHDTA